MSFHSTNPIDLKIMDALLTDLDTQTNLLILEKFGQILDKESKAAYEVMYTFSEQIQGYSYFVTNKLQYPIEVVFDMTLSKNMLSSNCSHKLTKTIEPATTEFMFHTRQAPDMTDQTKNLKITYTELKNLKA